MTADVVGARTNPIGIEPLSVFGLSPVAMTHLAADLGCEHVAVTRSGVAWDPPFYPPTSLGDDPQLRRDLAAALRERELSPSLADGFVVFPDQDVRTMAGDLAVMAELGVPLVNTVSLDPDLDRTIDQIGVLVDLAAGHGMATTLELCPGLTVGDLPTALAVVEAVGRPELLLLVDLMHVARSGATAADLAALDPRLVGYVQISDALQETAGEDYVREAIAERLVPGDGVLDLVGMLAVLPAEVVVSIEVPQYAQARAGVGPAERLGPSVTATRDLIARARA